MRKILSLLTTVIFLVTFSFTSFAEEESVPYPLVTYTEHGYMVFSDNENMLTDNEEEYVRDTITDAIAKKDISVGVVTSVVINLEVAAAYYGQISGNDADFALMLFNSEEYKFYFYGSAVEEFAHDDDAFWMTEDYIETDAYFAAALQFPLDIHYHTYYHEFDNTETTTEAAT